MKWDPGRYQQFADLRGRPFRELLARVDSDEPRTVVDLGCGPGDLTATLARRWPRARIVGIDSSPEMIAAASVMTEIDWQVADVAAFLPHDDVDVVISNATLQWVPSHRALLRVWMQALYPGAWLAFQVPGNFTAPSHTLMRKLAESPRWQQQLAGVLRHDHPVDTAVDYARLLQAGGFRADCWETEYVQVLPGEDPVLDWVRGTGLRPVLDALNRDDAAEFEREYAKVLRQAYPPGPAGTLFPFRRIFAVGVKP